MKIDEEKIIKRKIIISWEIELNLYIFQFSDFCLNEKKLFSLIPSFIIVEKKKKVSEKKSNNLLLLLLSSYHNKASKYYKCYSIKGSEWEFVVCTRVYLAGLGNNYDL